ncbi:hypothetical protein CIL03_09130 [Virgibacillus indicus]|uniref:DUF2254 domain-containing protein n=1 Tax=Virgibacillus indicus TaxID=2024554 RepID=A0A265NCG0_9BACI|nr:DUF2254 domain-containing protein [Virgibacillus indicus]OZU89159.1 hypothetical protein CIL03_09130 [Virgibacillus indicus]
MNRTKFWIDTRDSFWFVPLIYTSISVLLVFAINILDSWLIDSFKEGIPKLLVTDKDVSIELYGSLATAILTMTTISFSVIMVVLTTYSTQFSPRTLQDFMRSKVTHHVLGVYCFGFTFALLNLVIVGKNNVIAGPIFMVIIALFCLAFFVFFIHHSARWLQVNSLIGKIRNDAVKVIQHVYKKENYEEYEKWDEDEIDEIKEMQKTDIYTIRSGYVQIIEWNKLVNYTEKNQCTIDLHVQVGDFIPKGFPLLSVYNHESDYKLEEINHILVVGDERTDIQDAEFMIQKLVEISLKAISPAINDPHTAINCINRIGVLLIEIGEQYKEIKYIADRSGNLRILNHPKKYEDYLYKSFYQIRYYGKSDVSVMYSLIEVLYKIALVSDDAIKEKVWKFHHYIVDNIKWDSLSNLDYNHLTAIYEKFEYCCK